MTTPAAVFPLSKLSQQSLLKFSNNLFDNYYSVGATREQLLDVDCAYQREANLGVAHLEAKAANRYGDKSRIQDQTVPIVMPQVEAGVHYLSKVFLTGNPIFGVVTAKAELDNTAAMYDAILEENSIRGGWIRQLNLFFRDGLKYNLHGLEVDWKSISTFNLVTDTKFSATEGKPKEVIWSGNVIKRLDMYNTFFDTRVAPADVSSKGEFAGYVEMHGRVAFKQFVQNLDGVMKENIKPALESSNPGNSYYTPLINAQTNPPSHQDGNNWASWVTEGARTRINYSDSYEVMTIYVRLLPSDFAIRVPGSNSAQIWKLVIVNKAVVILAERQTNAHNNLNIVIGQPLEDGLNYQTKSFAQNAIPLQDAASAMLNASLNSKRRMQFDRLLYNPSLVSHEAINSANPIARIPVRNSAYNSKLSDAVYPFPYNDSASQGMLQEMGLLVNFADKLQGINASNLGQFTKGNRTLSEYEDVRGNSDGRFQTMALFIEAQVFVPVKEMLKLNILQYATDGEIFSREQKKLVTIDTLTLRKQAVEFKVSDGFLPASKLISTEIMQVAMQVIGSSPQLQQEIDLVGLFIHFLKSQGAKELDQFRRVPMQQPQQPQQPAPPLGAPQ